MSTQKQQRSGIAGAQEVRRLPSCYWFSTSSRSFCLILEPSREWEDFSMPTQAVGLLVMRKWNSVQEGTILTEASALVEKGLWILKYMQHAPIATTENVVLTPQWFHHSHSLNTVTSTLHGLEKWLIRLKSSRNLKIKYVFELNVNVLQICVLQCWLRCQKFYATKTYLNSLLLIVLHYFTIFCWLKDAMLWE
jgi:hypothetical protein